MHSVGSDGDSRKIHRRERGERRGTLNSTDRTQPLIPNSLLIRLYPHRSELIQRPEVEGRGGGTLFNSDAFGWKRIGAGAFGGYPFISAPIRVQFLLFFLPARPPWPRLIVGRSAKPRAAGGRASDRP